MAKTLEVNLATLEKQQEIIDKLNESGGGEINYLYTLASFDSTAMPTEIEALKGLKNIKSIVNSEAAMTAVANSSTAMEAVANSTTAMEAVANSTTAMEAVANSSTAMTAVANSSTAMTVVANSSTAMEAVLNSSTAMEAVLNSSTAMEAVANSSTAMETLLGSKNTKALKNAEISGRFLPLKANLSHSAYQAYNGTWSNVGTDLGAWLRANSSNPIATKIKAGNSYDIYYYDLDA